MRVHRNAHAEPGRRGRLGAQGLAWMCRWERRRYRPRLPAIARSRYRQCPRARARFVVVDGLQRRALDASAAHHELQPAAGQRVRFQAGVAGPLRGPRSSRYNGREDPADPRPHARIPERRVTREEAKLEAAPGRRTKRAASPMGRRPALRQFRCQISGRSIRGSTRTPSRPGSQWSDRDRSGRSTSRPRYRGR